MATATSMAVAFFKHKDTVDRSIFLAFGRIDVARETLLERGTYEVMGL